MRRRRRIARMLVDAHGLRAKIVREWRWLCRDVRDLRDEFHHHRRSRRAIP